MVAQFCPVPPGWQVVFNTPGYRSRYDLLGWIDQHPMVWHEKLCAAVAVADEIGATSYWIETAE